MKNSIAILLLSLCSLSLAYAAGHIVSDEEIKTQIIKNSISSYRGNCACPYNLASNGSQCGKRSAYSKPGGYAPLCYPSDISDKMVLEFRKKH